MLIEKAYPVTLQSISANIDLEDIFQATILGAVGLACLFMPMLAFPVITGCLIVKTLEKFSE